MTKGRNDVVFEQRLVGIPRALVGLNEGQETLPDKRL